MTAELDPRFGYPDGPVRSRHNSRTRRTPLALSEVDNPGRYPHPGRARARDDGAHALDVVVPHGGRPTLHVVGAAGRLTGTAARYVELNGEPRRPRRYPVDLIAREIRDNMGDVWPSVRHFGLSYEHALRIRNGWRGNKRPRGVPLEWRNSRNVGMRTPRWVLEQGAP